MSNRYPAHPLRRLRRLLHAVSGAAVGAAAVVAQAEDAASADAAPRPTVEIVTSEGPITVQLRPDRAPRTVANFLALVDERFYDGLIFHRVIPDFMIQVGGYDAAMNRRPAPRNVPNESVGGLSHERGAIAMARTADPESAGAQFYINMVASPHLDAKKGKPGYTVFGRVVAGMDVAERIERKPTHTVERMRDVPVEPVTILSVRRVAPGP